MTAADAEELFLLRSDPRVMEFVGREPAKTVQEVLDLVELINKNIDANETVMWAIALKNEPSRMIGNITLWQIDKDHYRAEIGYMLHPDSWGKGIMKEAISNVVNYGFDTMKLHSIGAKVEPGNKRSTGLLESIGFEKEAHFKEDFYFRGKFYDTLVYSLLNKN